MTETDDGTTRAELLSEVEGLRSRLQLLRAERTAMAGKKYALDALVEGFREQLEALQEAVAAGDPGRVEEVVRAMALLGEGRGSGGGGLESERLAQLEAMQRLEQQVVDLKEKVAGYRTERDALREQVGGLDRERAALAGRLEEAERARAELEAEGARGRVAELEAVLAEVGQRVERFERAARALHSGAGELRATVGRARGDEG